MGGRTRMLTGLLLSPTPLPLPGVARVVDLSSWALLPRIATAALFS